jgi:hypothetical protein
MSSLFAGTTATSSLVKPAQLCGKSGYQVATMTGTVVFWRKGDTLDPFGATCRPSLSARDSTTFRIDVPV